MGTKLHVQASAEKPYRELSPLGKPTPVLGFRASHPEPTQDPFSLSPCMLGSGRPIFIILVNTAGAH